MSAQVDILPWSMITLKDANEEPYWWTMSQLMGCIIVLYAGFTIRILQHTCVRGWCALVSSTLHVVVVTF